MASPVRERRCQQLVGSLVFPGEGLRLRPGQLASCLDVPAGRVTDFQVTRREQKSRGCYGETSKVGPPEPFRCTGDGFNSRRWKGLRLEYLLASDVEFNAGSGSITFNGSANLIQTTLLRNTALVNLESID